MAEALAKSGRRGDPLFLPFLFGSPHGPDVAASFVGLRGWHDRGDVLRARPGGVVFNHRTHMDPLTERFAPPRPLRVCGGGSKSPGWTQLLADGLGTSVEVTDTDEAGARGAALLAGIGSGVYTSTADAVERAVRVVRRHEPQPGRVAELDARYRRYRRVADALSALPGEDDDSNSEGDAR